MYRSPVGPSDRLLRKLLQAQKTPVVGWLIQQWLKFRGVDIPPSTFERAPLLIHGGQAVVHSSSTIAEDVTIFHNVTVGRADVWEYPDPTFEGATIERDVILCAGAVVLPRRGPLIVAEGSVVGANSVLTCSTGPWEIWAGAPARLVGKRPRPQETEAVSAPRG